MASVTPKVRRQVKAELLPILGPGFFVTQMPGSPTVARTYGCFTQFLILAIGRYGDVEIMIDFHAIGTQPDRVPPQRALVLARDELFRDWNFNNEDVAAHGLDMSFIVTQVEKRTPASFIEPLTEASVLTCFRYFERHAVRFFEPAHIAFYHMAQGEISRAPAYLRTARRMLDKEYRGVSELNETALAFYALLDKLEHYAQDPGSRAECRSVAERHAAELNFPPIVWPN